MALTREDLEPAPGEDASDRSSDGSPKGSRVSRVDALLCCEHGVPGRDGWRDDSTRGRCISPLAAIFQENEVIGVPRERGWESAGGTRSEGRGSSIIPPYKQSPE